MLINGTKASSIANERPPNAIMILPIIIKVKDPNNAGHNFTQKMDAPNALLIQAMNDSIGGTSKNPAARCFPSAR
ncbi:hypothetical protein D9M68_975140 [compost metagenome]